MNDQKTVVITELLAQNAERILSQLLRGLVETGGPSYQQMPLEVLETRVQRLFDAFWQGIAQSDPKPLTDFIWTTWRERGGEGFSVDELQTVGLHLRDILLDLVDETYADDSELRLRYSRHMEELILTGIGSGVRGYVNGREALIDRQYEALRRNQKRKKDNQG